MDVFYIEDGDLYHRGLEWLKISSLRIARLWRRCRNPETNETPETNGGNDPENQLGLFW